jgi:hypothetical protein
MMRFVILDELMAYGCTSYQDHHSAFGFIMPFQCHFDCGCFCSFCIITTEYEWRGNSCRVKCGFKKRRRDEAYN